MIHVFAKKKQEHVAKRTWGMRMYEAANQCEVGKVQQCNIHHWHINLHKFVAVPDISEFLLLVC